MRAVPMSEFKDNVSDYVSAARAGEEIVITFDGQPAVRLTPAESREEILQRQRLAIERMLANREKLRAEGVRVSAAEIREWIDEGRP